ncbi:MAG: AMP-binding protein [Comamonadaceae bacterium]|nr:AMP-binding protein [Comamonadaceae bacterium]
MTQELEMNLLRRQNLGDSLRRAAKAAGDKPAIIFYTADGAAQTHSYVQLNALVNTVANNLLRRGIRKGDRVAALSRNNVPFLALGYALHKIGAWLVPVNFMLQPTDVQHLIEFAEAKWFFVEDALLGNVDAVPGKMACVEQFVQFSVSGKAAPAGWLAFAELASGPADEPQVLVDSDDVATMFFTSGTESSPKGVLTSHANFYASQLAWALNFGLAQDDRFLLSIPLIHMAGYLFASFGLANQVTLVMTQVPQPVQMIDLIERHRLTAAALPPTLYVAMLSCPNFRTRDLSSASKMLTWASTIPKAMVDGWKEVAPAMRFFSGQGSSESTAGPLTGGYVGSWAEMPNGDGRWVGRQMCFSADVRLVDDDGKDVADGESGEQIVRGPVIMKGYYKNDEVNRRVFRDGWFHTGDILFRDAAGNYFFADRKKDMIKTGGENVYCQEVESVLGTHAGVMQCAVFGLPDERWGEAVTAAVIARPGTVVTEAELIEFCRGRLPGFKAPKRIHFRSSLPISAANKILKRDLKTEYANEAKGG